MAIHFTDFDAWNKAMDLAQQIHELTKSFPKEERYGIVAQIRKASVSTAANIAEGFGRYTAPDKQHKYVQARGELVEVMTYLHHSARILYITKETCQSLLNLCEDIYKMLNALITKMHARPE